MLCLVVWWSEETVTQDTVCTGHCCLSYRNLPHLEASPQASITDDASEFQGELPKIATVTLASRQHHDSMNTSIRRKLSKHC
jgi:hypothetical protein